MTAEPNLPSRGDAAIGKSTNSTPQPFASTDASNAKAFDRIAETSASSSEPGGMAMEDRFQDDAVVERVEGLNPDVGWVLISAGIVGMIVPGIIGTPFLIMGAFALWPGNRPRVEKWRKGHSPKLFHGSMKQINRFLDDLERRYPRIGKR